MSSTSDSLSNGANSPNHAFLCKPINFTKGYEQQNISILNMIDMTIPSISEGSQFISDTDSQHLCGSIILYTLTLARQYRMCTIDGVHVLTMQYINSILKLTPLETMELTGSCICFCFIKCGRGAVINPRRACAARITVLVCVKGCVC